MKKATKNPFSPFAALNCPGWLALAMLMLSVTPFLQLKASEVIVGGTLSQNTLWTGQNTYTVTESIVVPENITLTIEGGALVRFNQASGLRVEGGRLFIQGSASDTVYMRPNHQDGDSWYWKGVTITSSPEPERIHISHVHIHHAETGLTGNGSHYVTLEHSRIKDNLLVGVQLNNASYWQIHHNHVSGNIRGLEILANSPGSLSEGNQVHHNFFQNDNVNIYAESTNSAIFRDNSLADNLLSGALREIWLFQTPQGISQDNVIERNIILGGLDDGQSGQGILSSMNDVQIRNNILYQHAMALDLDASDTGVLHNSFHDNQMAFVLRNGNASLNMQYNTIAVSRDIIGQFFAAHDIQFMGNAMLGNAHTEGAIQNLTDSDLSLVNNFWGTSLEEVIQHMIFDGNTDPQYGFVSYDPFLGEPPPGAPMSPPAGVHAQHVHGQTRLTWQGNPEADVAGYRVYFGTFANYAFSHVLDEPLTDTLAVLPHTELNGLAVTAIDASWPVSGAQVMGHESPYGMATFLPWAGEDASICSTQTLHNIHHSTAPGNPDSVSWTTSGDGAFSNPATLRPLYFPGSADRETGVVTLTLTMSKDGTSLSDSFILHLVPPPQVHAGYDAIIAPGEVFLTEGASASHHDHLQWSSGGDGFFAHPDSLITAYVPGPEDLAAGWVTLTLLAISDHCGEVSSHVHLLIRDTYSVSGRVHAGSEQPASHPVMAIRMPGDLGQPVRSLVSTGADGHFHFDALFAGHYVFYSPADTSQHDHMLSAYHPSQIHWEDAYLHHLGSDIRELDIRLQPSPHQLPQGEGAITGFFALESVHPFDIEAYCLPWFSGDAVPCQEGLSNVTVKLLGPSLAAIYLESLTGDRGQFTFENLPYGEYVLQAEMAPHAADVSPIINLHPGQNSLDGVKIHFTEENRIGFSMPKNEAFRISPQTSFTSQEHEWQLYPNPVSNLLHLRSALLADDVSVSISVFDSLGQEVHRETLSPDNGQLKIRLDHLPRGLYVLRIISPSFKQAKTFIKS